MVLYVMKWNIHPDKVDEYLNWTKSSIPRTMSVPGVIEFRAYRPASGSSQVVVTYEFADMSSWAAWQGHEDMQALLSELHTVAAGIKLELWGPSPVVPEPMRTCD
ncbi:MAG: antibiotic biosynthesis monooxygenase family protein [Bacillota bacterium]|nr:antibiotic biosynthesis monooxygenase family protein [Bacillota bacterium]